jgi:nucleoside-diphosphate-sugar epimerase
VKALVTGASGFIGGHLVERLVKEGITVRILARRSSKLNHLAKLPLETVYGDLSDLESLREAVAGVQVIYHCAALSADWGTAAMFHQANVVGVQNVVTAALQNDHLERFVHISTTDVYGYPVQPCDETYPITGIGLPYNISKGLGEQAVWDAHRQYGLPMTVIRPVSVYGPRGTEFVQRIGEHLRAGDMAVFDGGRTHAGLLYIDNGVDFILRASLAPVALGQAYNLRDDHDTNWREYLELLAAALGLSKPRLNLPTGLALAVAHGLETLYRWRGIAADPPLTRHAILIMARDQGYLIDKAKREIGFNVVVGLEEGIARSAAWLRSAWLG